MSVAESVMESKISLFNFSGIYDKESFYRKDKGSYLCGDKEATIISEVLDLSGISGTNCMCDDLAKESIRKMIAERGIGPDGIHFIDNGNYHYMSAIMLEQVKEPFSLVVLDHHPDMQPPMFGDILSCGGWVLNVVENNPFVKDVHVIGADRKLIAGLDTEIQEKALFYDREDVIGASDLEGEISISLPETKYPVYLSIDKDVICKDEIITNWDQGEMRAKELLAFVKAILGNCKVLGIDVCGECAPDQEGIDVDRAAAGNDSFNEKLICSVFSEARV